MNRKIEKWKIADLKPHPSQAALFEELNAVQLAELAESMAQRGLDHPVEIKPDGTILCGHERVRAAQLLGWDEIDVWIRDDLLAQGETACEMRLIQDNLQRRHLKGLAFARAYRRLKELEKSLPRAERSKSLRGDMRDLIALKLNCSGRNADRYLRVLEAPTEVQAAFDRGEVSLVDACRVSALAKDVQEQIADRIRNGDNAKPVIAEHLRRPRKAALRPIAKVVGDLIAAAAKCRQELRGRWKELRSMDEATLQSLHEARQFVRSMALYVEQHQRPNKESTNREAATFPTCADPAEKVTHDSV